MQIICRSDGVRGERNERCSGYRTPNDVDQELSAREWANGLAPFTVVVAPVSGEF